MSRPISLQEHTFVQFLYLAKRENLGLILRTNDAERAATKFRAVKAKLEDPALDDLQIVPWGHPEGDLVIVNRFVELDDKMIDELRINGVTEI